ncbi:MAG TPA: PqqD family peptide modification chaperone [Candidatus Fermentibacter sp.]|nr:PqqD family peptide modification chaperone [Candidatus Fermentibacter sp.]
MTEDGSLPGTGGRLQRNPDVVLREEDEDGALLFNPDTSEVRVLNATGLFVWRMCDGVSEDDLVSALSAAFDSVPPGRVREDVDRFVCDLLASGFMGRAPGG